MGQFRILAIDDFTWDTCVEACSFHDAYHHADYHRAMATRGRSVLIASDAGAESPWALPLVLHPIEDVVPGATGLDAISVYGFTGMAGSAETLDSDQWARIWTAVKEALRELDVVSLFVRLHPLDSREIHWPADAQVVAGGPTVLMNLAGLKRDDLGSYAKTHRYDVRRALNDGLRFTWTAGIERLDAFTALYAETMARNYADASYLFTSDQLRLLFNSHQFGTFTGAVEARGHTLAMSLFLVHPPFAQYFLSGGARTEHGSRPSKLMIHAARAELLALGCRVLHLGGGVGSREDSLFAFKSGFSEKRSVFCSLRWVLDERRYSDTLCARFGENSNLDYSTGWFPRYRAPRQA